MAGEGGTGGLEIMPLEVFDLVSHPSFLGGRKDKSRHTIWYSLSRSCREAPLTWERAGTKFSNCKEPRSFSMRHQYLKQLRDAVNAGNRRPLVWASDTISMPLAMAQEGCGTDWRQTPFCAIFSCAERYSHWLVHGTRIFGYCWRSIWLACPYTALTIGSTSGSFDHLTTSQLPFWMPTQGIIHSNGQGSPKVAASNWHPKWTSQSVPSSPTQHFHQIAPHDGDRREGNLAPYLMWYPRQPPRFIKT